jgi:phage I-like protein
MATKLQRGWYPIAPAGEFPNRGVVQVLDAAAFRAMAENFRGPLLVDFDHYSELTPEQREGLAALKVDLPSDASGHIHALRATQAGLEAEIEWTPEGAAALAGKRYKNLSPVFRRANAEDLGGGRLRPVELKKAGLTNEPNLPLPDLANRDRAADFTGPAVDLSNRNAVDSVPTVDTEETERMKNIAIALGLPETATEADVLAKIKALQDAASQLESAKAGAAELENRAKTAEAKVIDFEKAKLDAEVEKDLASLGDLPNRAEVKAAMLAEGGKNRVTILAALKPAKLGDLPNRSNRTPDDKGAGGPDRAKIVDDLANANRCTRAEAWDIAQRLGKFQ